MSIITDRIGQHEVLLTINQSMITVFPLQTAPKPHIKYKS